MREKRGKQNETKTWRHGHSDISFVWKMYFLCFSWYEKKKWGFSKRKKGYDYILMTNASICCGTSGSEKHKISVSNPPHCFVSTYNSQTTEVVESSLITWGPHIMKVSWEHGAQGLLLYAFIDAPNHRICVGFPFSFMPFIKRFTWVGFFCVCLCSLVYSFLFL